MDQEREVIERIQAIEQRLHADSFWGRVDFVFAVAALLAMNFVVALLVIPKADAFLSGMQSEYRVHVPLLTRGVIRLAWGSVAVDALLLAAVTLACLKSRDFGKVRGISYAALSIMGLKVLLLLVGLFLPSFEIVEALSM